MGDQYDCEWHSYELGDRYTAWGRVGANGWIILVFAEPRIGLAYSYMTCWKNV